ncbi:MAG: hypothetical protein D6807_01395 [Alphaproteobacteria bacterium]|nr:MAG: hypothetical protein D6807_01395 [Alphaproteobacteria bacterium]
MSTVRVFVLGFLSSAAGALALALALAVTTGADAPWLGSLAGAVLGSALGWMLLHQRQQRH